MKTRKLRYLATGLVFLLILGSCSDDLERFPHSSIEQSQSFETVEDAATWNVGMYGLLQNRVYGMFMYSTDIQADQLNASLDYGNRNGGIHRWDFLADDYTIRDVWRLYYSGITNANVAIEGMETIEVEDPADQALLDRYIADAHLVRAYYYHQLMLFYASDYDPATAATDLGVPLVLEYDINNFPSRSTVEQVYQQILADIQVAETGLAGVEGTPGSMYFTADVATALKARVKLHMEDWAGAFSAANELITSGNYPLITDPEVFASYWYEDYPQEDILQLYVSAPNELANTNGIYLGYNAGTGRYSPDFIPSQWVIDAYPDDDMRKSVYFEELPVTLGGLEYDLTLVTKYPGNPALFTGATTNYQHAPKVFRIAEMYLIAAEAATHLPNEDALVPLNDLRTARGLEALSSISGDDLMDAVRDERFRELAFEGFRLEDLQRWDEGFSRREAQNLDAIQTGPKFNELTVEPTNPKFIWGIPSNDITINPNLRDQQNPGW